MFGVHSEGSVSEAWSSVVWYLWQAGFIPWGTCRNAVMESFIIVFRSFISIIHLQSQPGSQDLRVLVREVGVGVYVGV